MQPLQPRGHNPPHHHPSHQPHRLQYLLTPRQTNQTRQTTLLHQHHLPPNHLTADAATITKVGASQTTTIAAAIDIAAGTDTIATLSITAPPGDAVHPQHPPTPQATHSPAAAPHHQPLTYAPTLNTPTPTPHNGPLLPSSVAQPTAGDLHPTSTLFHLQINSWNGSNSMPTN